jgi:hypothetical protein
MEHMCGDGWNGNWGRLALHDIWLSREVRWHVRAREEDSDSGRELAWDYNDEESARAAVCKLMDPITQTSTSPRPPAPPDERRRSCSPVRACTQIAPKFAAKDLPSGPM